MSSSERPRGNVQFDNTGRVVLITGGCGGIGQAICQAFCQSAAAAVVALDIDPSRKNLLPQQAIFRQTDVAQEVECKRAADWTIAEFGSIDVLVNAVGIQPAESYCGVDQLDAAVWQRMLDVNLSSYTYMAKAVLPIMLRQQSGVIVNIASAQGHRTAREVPAYGPMKAGNILQAMQWGVEYARRGIRVVSVSPGAIETPMLKATLAAQGGGAALANRHPLGRLGAPHEVASAVLWLASPAASFITATDVAVDGGLSALGAFADPYRMSSSSDADQNQE